MGIKINPNIDLNSLIRSATSKEFLDKQIDDIVDYLQRKYNEQFEVLRYGDRDDKYNDDIKIICKSKSNPDVVFYATGNSSKKYEDNYCSRLILTELEQSIKNEFKNHEINANVKIDNAIKKKINMKMTLKQYIESGEDQVFLGYIVLEGEVQSSIVKQTLDNVKSNYPGIKLRAFVYRMNSTNFENYCKFANSVESTSRTIIQKYLPSKVEVIE